jgi:hypothetical protein
MWPENHRLALFERATDNPCAGICACNVFRLAEKEAVGRGYVRAFVQTITMGSERFSSGAKAHGMDELMSD